MAQVPINICPQCGASVAEGQRFCANCGATMDRGFSNPTVSASSAGYSQYPDMSTQQETPPPPPQGTVPPAQQAFSQQQPGGFYQPPAYAQPVKDSTKGVLGQIGCGVLVIILLIVGSCGAISYFGYVWLQSLAASSTSTTTGSGYTSNGGYSGGTTPTAVPPVTSKVNTTVTYKGAVITILNVQQGNSFAGDNSGTTNGIVRLNLKEHNPTTDTIFLNYTDSARLILPDGTSVAPTAEQGDGIVNQAVVIPDWLDFPIPLSDKGNQLKLRLGTDAEAQMDIPLDGHADVSKYQAKTIKPGTTFQYAGASWQLTSVTSSLSISNTQATKGMRYIIVTVKVNNTSTNTLYFNANTSARLKAGGVVNAPVTDDFPGVINPGTTANSGTIVFLMPQDSSAFTFMLLATDNPPASQATADFQI